VATPLSFFVTLFTTLIMRDNHKETKMNRVLGKLEVVVNDGRWHAYGDLTDPGTNYAMGVLTGMGGINETVTNGIWEFTVVQAEDGLLMTSLLPIS
jgi:hypothetical protein